MKTGITQIFFTAALTLAAFSVNAQDIHYSMFNETPVMLNPARAGVPFSTRIILNYKDQWQSVASPYKTMAFSGDVSLFKSDKRKAYMGLGLNVFNDKAGDVGMKTTQVGLSASAILAPDANNKISIGLMGGFMQRSIGTGNQQWGSQYDGTAFNPNLASGENMATQNYNLPDAGVGINWYYGKGEKYMTANDGVKLDFGVAMFHPHGPKYSFYGDANERLDPKIVAHGWASFGTGNSNLCIEPSFLFVMQGPQKELTPGVNLKYILSESSKYTGRKKASAFSLGGYMRTKDALILTTMFEYSSYAAGFSYDLNTSTLKTVSHARGGMEFFIRFVFPNPFGSDTSKSMI
ncbi:MAG TPA: PorP/SprF family type IX secretion system membrane protein [Bacteroidia bacterium]|nr:PorP/SprF family type IX secretion system membrane protein [Bacteroidia bacterium]